MDRRNISILIGILLLTGLLVWIVTSDVEYVFPPEIEGLPSQEATPLWAALLAWQGDQQRTGGDEDGTADQRQDAEASRLEQRGPSPAEEEVEGRDVAEERQ